MLPEIDGLHVCKLLQADPSTARIPILMLTANAMPGDKEKCIDAGADAYLAKPISFDQLVSIVLELTSV